MTVGPFVPSPVTTIYVVADVFFERVEDVLMMGARDLSWGWCAQNGAFLPFGQPVNYQRRYVFGDDALEISVILNAEEDVRLQRLVECVPIARGGWKARGAIIEAGGRHSGPVAAASFRVYDETGAGVQFSLDNERNLTLVPDGLQTPGWRPLQIGRVEIELPATLAEGESIELRYSILPLTSG